jgi:hypothetical protein
MAQRSMMAVVVLSLVSFLVSACGSDDAGSDSMDLAAVNQAGSDRAEEPASEKAADEYFADEDSSQPAQIHSSDFDRRVIRNGEIDLEVSDVETASRQFRELVADRGGFMTSSSAQTLSEDRKRNFLSFDVPAEQFESTLDRMRDHSIVTEVIHESTTTQDVTEEYVDLESRLSNLMATEARFVELLDSAISISEILDVEYELSRVRGEIEQLQGRINYLDQRTSYSRISVTLEQAEDERSTVAGSPFTPGETAREAWDASMQFIGTVANSLITIAVFFWWGWPLIILAVFAIRYLRKQRQPVVPA